MSSRRKRMCSSAASLCRSKPRRRRRWAGWRWLTRRRRNGTNPRWRRAHRRGAPAASAAPGRGRRARL